MNFVKTITDIVLITAIGISVICYVGNTHSDQEKSKGESATSWLSLPGFHILKVNLILA